jgi:hypothetical protein
MGGDHDESFEGSFDASFDGDRSAFDARFELGEWGTDERVELVEELIAAGIRHDWEGDELVVMSDDTERVEAILDRFEEDDVEGDVDEEEFDVDDWSDNERREFAAILVARGIVHRFDDDALIVGVDDADTVEELLDQFD